MITLNSLTVKVSEKLLRWRWLVILLIGLIFVGFEIAEHLGAGHGFDAHFVREILFFGVAGPLAVGVILTLLAHTRAELVHAFHRLDRQHALSQQLSGIQDWDELTAALVQFPRTVAPFIGVSLFVHDPIRARFELAAEWWHPDWQVSASPTRLLNQGLCNTCKLAQSPVLCSLDAGHCLDDPRIPEGCKRYGLLLMHADRPIALLFLYVAPHVLLTKKQMDILNSMAPAMALAIDNIRPQRSAMIRAEASEDERRRIARQLHDTLGQSLGFLHLKLDQLMGDDALAGIEAVREELERMRDVANQAYGQVRGTLADLRSVQSGDLATALLDQARSVSRRADFGVQLVTEGQTRPLSPSTQHQVLCLFQEALTNVEKHAGAQQVCINLNWAEDALTVGLSDDGRGFEPDALQPNGHYGLTIMRERAEEIDGSLTLASCPDAGTKLTLRLPLSGSIQSTGHQVDSHR